ncbi:hypothetical protein MH052_08970 [Bacillus altitudinis]|nr:hypothetical protein [Bacillus altitudinis]MCY7713109.1 hypothetical protein [Bacillus altitudinis]
MISSSAPSYHGVMLKLKKYKYLEVIMTTTTILGIVTMVIWILVSTELSKNSKKDSDQKENSRRKLIVLMFAGIVLTIAVVISLFQKL